MLPVFQLNMDQRQAVDHHRDIKAPVPLIQLLLALLFEGPVLVDHLIDAGAAGDMRMIQHQQVKGIVPPLHMDIDSAVLAHQPPARVIEGGKLDLVPDLLELRIGERNVIQLRLVVLLQNVAEVGPQVFLRFQVRPVSPLGIPIAQLFYQLFFNRGFKLRHGLSLLCEHILQHELLHGFERFDLALLPGDEGVELFKNIRDTFLLLNRRQTAFHLDEGIPV